MPGRSRMVCIFHCAMGTKTYRELNAVSLDREIRLPVIDQMKDRTSKLRKNAEKNALSRELFTDRPFAITQGDPFLRTPFYNKKKWARQYFRCQELRRSARGNVTWPFHCRTWHRAEISTRSPNDCWAHDPRPSLRSASSAPSFLTRPRSQSLTYQPTQTPSRRESFSCSLPDDRVPGSSPKFIARTRVKMAIVRR